MGACADPLRWLQVSYPQFVQALSACLVLRAATDAENQDLVKEVGGGGGGGGPSLLPLAGGGAGGACAQQVHSLRDVGLPG